MGLELIEESFKRLSQERDEYFEYYHIYFATKYILCRHYYPYVRDILPYYTDHSIGHINRILRKLYFLLRPQLLTDNESGAFGRSYISLDKTSKKLNIYEMYLLMCSALWHDIGNLYGRNNHEKNIAKVFNNAKPFLYDFTSSEWIEKISMAHSGKNAIDDYIDRETKNEGDFTFYPKFLAALLRLADELDEDKERVGATLYNMIPEEKKAYWFFCKCNDSIKIEKDDLDRHKIVIEGRMDKKDIKTKLKKEIALNEICEVVGIEEYIRRIDKMNKERQYCSCYLKPRYFKPVEYIQLRLRIYKSIGLNKEIEFIFDDANGYDDFFKKTKF
jgi:hypothetical protein